MSSSDPAIKLFGKTIIALPLPTQDDGGHDNEGFPSEGTATSTSHEIIIMKEKGEDTRPASDEQGIDAAPTTTPVDHEAPKRSHSSSADEDEDEDDDDDNEDDQAGKGPKSSQGNNKHSDSSGSNAQEKPPLKKPDKILPCPRCSSMDTKFCYYNNYNVNQPRHFCKKCQRYWTAGGTMRNVPVGAGRRKNKNAAAAAHYRHLTITDAAALQAIATPDSAHHLALNPNGTVLSFGSADAPLRESMASVLNLAEKTIKSCNRNGFHRTDEQMEERSTGSSTACLNSGDEGNGANLHQEPAIRNYQGFAPHVPCTNGASSPWPYPWGPPQPASPTAPHPAPPFCGSSFPIPIYPAAAAAAAAAAYWGCTTWGMPWIAPMASTTSPTSGFGSNNSPTLGKHSREGEVLHRGGESFKQSNQEEKNLWVPKTLRIDDPEDAAKSSIWATMGFSRDGKPGGVMSGRKGGGGLFKTFRNSKEEAGCHDRAESNSQVLHANPAALSRRINFNESS